jgi:hypothetical protein
MVACPRLKDAHQSFSMERGNHFSSPLRQLRAIQSESSTWENAFCDEFPGSFITVLNRMLAKTTFQG